jgi:type IV secretory pathway VirB10-like protein
MPETNSDPFTPPGVQDKRTKPPGILPRNTQAWILIGLAVLMVAMIALTGKNPPKEKRVEPPPPAFDPNAARIQEYQKRIEEEARKLQLEQAQVARTRESLGLAPGVPAAPAAIPASHEPNYRPGPYPRAGELRPASAGPSPDENGIEADKKKREYQSLFASNVALSYRKESAPAAPTPSPAEALARTLLSYGYPLPGAMAPAPAQPGLLQANAAPAEKAGPGSAISPARDNKDSADERAARGRGKESYGELQRAEGKQYRLFEGTVLETVLTNRLDGDFSGPVNCMVTTNVYSHDGQRLLIPQGSRVLGEVRKIETFGERRLAVAFHRLITPDGYSASLDKFQGLNQIGETGLVDQVNHHYLQIFGVSLAIGAIAGLSQANTRAGLDTSATDSYRQGVSSSLSQSSLHILDRYLNVLPTFTIREGHRVKVYLSDDLLLPAYEKHQLPSDL